VGALGSDAHRVLIERIVDHYHGDVRVRAVAVFGSVSTGAWHDLSDVDVDVVIETPTGYSPTSSSFWTPWCETPSAPGNRSAADADGLPF
jgi:Nucleotidyltransferase domain